MNTKTLIAIFAIVTVASMIIPAYAGGHLALKSSGTDATIQMKGKNLELSASFKANADIPVLGTSGAFGFGVLTDGGSGALDNVVSLVTHLPIDDSAFEDPVSGFHTHVLDLKVAAAPCPTGVNQFEVDLAGSAANGAAFDPDYTFDVKKNTAKIKKVPVGDLGNPTSVIAEVAFTITPVFTGPTLTNLCLDVKSSVS